MNKRKGYLEELRNNNSAVFEKAVNIMQRYYKIYDLDNGTIHFKVFTMLYASNQHYTYNTVCEKLGLSQNTLKRYKAKYDQVAIKIIQRLNI